MGWRHANAAEDCSNRRMIEQVFFSGITMRWSVSALA
jgi:hypothetical protein